MSAALPMGVAMRYSPGLGLLALPGRLPSPLWPACIEVEIVGGTFGDFFRCPEADVAGGRYPDACRLLVHRNQTGAGGASTGPTPAAAGRVRTPGAAGSRRDAGSRKSQGGA